jgi:hemoglobin
MTDIQTREDIIRLVDTFYDKVQEDEVIGYFFNDVAKVDWAHHLPKMYDFWETTLFHQPKYKGNPMRVHVDLHQKETMEKEHFDRWLSLFKQTVDELFKGVNAENIKMKGESIATVMHIKVYQKSELRITN